MEKTARLKERFMFKENYERVMRIYKDLLKEGDKRKLYRFKGLVYACLNPSKKEGGWRSPDSFFGEETHDTIMLMIKSKSWDNWFGHDIKDCIKKTI